MDDEKIRQQVNRAIGTYDAKHPNWRYENDEGLTREAKEVRERARREQEAKQQAKRQQELAAAANNTQNWQNWIDNRIVEHVEEQFKPWGGAIGEVISNERADRRKETKTAVEESERRLETKFATKLAVLEERLKATPSAEQQTADAQWRAETNQRLKNLELEIGGRLGPDSLHTNRREIEAKLEALEQRVKTAPGKMPVVKAWRPESVTYQAEFVCHEGALYQAKRDTAQTPGGLDWTCVARAGRDAITPRVRSTYDAHEKYKQLDIVAMDGAAFIAKRDDPGICPGAGWQLMSCQGKRGHRGERGETGPRGEKGEAGPSTVSWQLERERYRVSPLESDGRVGPMLELRALFDQFMSEISGYLIRRPEDGSG